MTATTLGIDDVFTEAEIERLVTFSLHEDAVPEGDIQNILEAAARARTTGELVGLVLAGRATMRWDADQDEIRFLATSEGEIAAPDRLADVWRRRAYEQAARADELEHLLYRISETATAASLPDSRVGCEAGHDPIESAYGWPEDGWVVVEDDDMGPFDYCPEHAAEYVSPERNRTAAS